MREEHFGVGQRLEQTSGLGKNGMFSGSELEWEAGMHCASGPLSSGTLGELGGDSCNPTRFRQLWWWWTGVAIRGWTEHGPGRVEGQERFEIHHLHLQDRCCQKEAFRIPHLLQQDSNRWKLDPNKNTWTTGERRSPSYSANSAPFAVPLAPQRNLC